MSRNVRERRNDELRFLAIVLAAIAAAVHLGKGAGIVLIADGPCSEQPALDLPAWADPNLIAGHLIAVEQIEAGKFVGRIEACDPCDWPVTLEVLTPAGMSVTADPDGPAWWIAGELGPGDHGIVCRAVNRPRYGEPNETIVTVYVRVAAPEIPRPIVYWRPGQ